MKPGNRLDYGTGHSGPDLPPRAPGGFASRTEPDGAQRLAALSALVDNLTRQIDVMEDAALRQPPKPPVQQPQLPQRPALDDRFEALGRQLDNQQSERLSGIETRLATLASQIAAARSAPAAQEPASAPVAAAQVASPPENGAPVRPRADAIGGLQAAIAEISSRQRAIDAERSTPPNAFDAIAIEDAIASLRDDIALLGRRINAEARRSDESGQSLKTELATRIQALAETRPVPETGAVDDLRRELVEVKQAMAQAARETTLVSLESGYRHIIERLDDIVRHAPETERFDRLTRDIAALSASIETATPARELETEIEDIRNAVASLTLSRPDAAVERQIAKLQAAIDSLAARPAPTIDFSGIEREIDALRRDMDGLSRGADPMALARLEKQIDGIRIALDTYEPRTPGIDSTALSRLEDRLDALAGRFDALTELPTLRAPAAPDAFDGLRAEVNQMRQDFAAREPVRLDAIEAQMQALVRRLDETSRPGDNKALAQLEAQVGALAEQISAGPEPRGLARVEENLDRLHSLIGSSRQDTIEAAREAARATFREFAGSQPAAADDQLIQALREDMRALQAAAERSDRQTHDTLEAVHDTLAKVVDRIAQLEIDELAAAAHPPRAAGAIGARLDVGLPEEHRPLAPGSGRPASQASAPPVAPQTAPARPGDRKADFIAAARRAAQAAQSETAGQIAENGPEGDRPNTFTRIGDALRARKRPLVLAIAAIVLALGAMQLTDPPGRQAAKPAATKSTAADAPATDPLATGSIPAKPARPATPSTPAAKPAPNAMVAPSQDGSGALAFAPAAETDNRFAALAPDAPSASSFSTPGDTAGLDLETAAAKGDAVAAFEMGRRLAEGSNGQAKDAPAAADWYLKAAEAGLAVAQYRIGSLYERGDGVQRDLAAAQGWYEKASAQGNARATHNLAVLMSEGATGDPDYVRAAQFFTQAANLGVADSQYNLGVLYARGLGVSVDLVQSYKWFALAAQQGDRDAGKRRDEVGKAMKPDALAAARAVVQTFKAQPLDTTANSEPRIRPEWKNAVAQTTMRDTGKVQAPRG